MDKIKGFGNEIVNCSAEVSAEQSAFAQIMGDYSKQAQEKLQSVADATGMLDSRLTPYMTSMTAKFKGLGYGIDDSTDLAQRGLNLAADAAAFWDKTLQDSMGGLNSFINGSYEGGEAIGLFANDTQLASYAVKQGIVGETKEWASLEEARKQATRLQYAEDMYKMSGATGQAAKESAQYANVQANLTEKWRQFKAQIGEPVLQNIVLPAMEKLSGIVDTVSQKFEQAQPFIQEFGNKIASAKDKAIELGNYASETFAPVMDKIGDVFKKGKEMVQPFIDALGDYIGSGEAAADATNFIKDAIDIAASVTSGLLDGIEGIARGFQDMYTWGQQNVGTLTVLGVVVAGFTTAIAANTIASNMHKIAMGLSTVAIGVYNGVTTIATTVTTAFGSAVAFLTSPITIVIAIITALIAIGVLLYQNWDVVKAKCIELGQKLSQIWQSIKNTIISVWNSIYASVTSIVNSIKSVITNIFNSVKSTVSSILNAIKSTFTSIWNAIKSTVDGAINGIKSVISNGLNAAKNTVSSVLESIKSKFSSIMNSAKDIVKSAIDKIKGFFNFSWSLPKLKLPHISISGEFSLSPPSVPRFGIEWYKKAMDNPMVLDSPTIFGYNPAAGNFLGAGEAGKEIVSGANTLKSMIREAVAAEQSGNIDRVVELLEMLLDWLTNGGLKHVLIEVLTNDVKLKWENRELARLVRTYA